LNSGGPCDEGQKCDKLLDDLENIDDEADESGIQLVTTEETGFANKFGITTFPLYDSGSTVGSRERPSIYILDPADRYGNSGPVHHVMAPLLAVLLATAVSSLKQRTADKFICLNSFRCHMSLAAFVLFVLKNETGTAVMISLY